MNQRVMLARFRALMLEKLRKHPDYSWDNTIVLCLLDRLHQETDELVRALVTNNPRQIGRECADVANFAMGIAYLSGALEADADAGKGAASEA